MEIYLINHTRPNIDSDICYGATDVDVASSYEKDKTQVAGNLPGSFQAVYSSPSKRCIKLAMELNGELVVQDDRIGDLNYGDWEMKKWHLIDQKLMDEWMTDFSDIAPKNGESFLRLNHRVEQFWEELIHEKVDKIAIVTHANVIRSSLSLLLDLPLPKAMGFQLKYGSVSKLTLDNSGLKIDFVNR